MHILQRIATAFVNFFPERSLGDGINQLLDFPRGHIAHKKPIERAERAAGVAFPNRVVSGKELFENGAAGFVVAHHIGVDAFGQRHESVTHTQEVAVERFNHGKDVRKLSLHLDVAHRADTAFPQSLDAFVNFSLFMQQTVYAFFDVFIGIVDKLLKGVDEKFQATFCRRNTYGVLRRNKAHRFKRSHRQRINGLGIAIGEASHDKTRVTPGCHALCSHFAGDGVGRDLIHETHETIHKVRLHQLAFFVVEQRLQIRNRLRASIGGKQ